MDRRTGFVGQAEGDSLVYQGDRVDLVLRPTVTTSGKSSVREVCLHRGAVIIVPVLQAAGEGGEAKIVLIKNARHTVFDTLLELPAGTLEYGEDAGNAHRPGAATEDPAEAAARELTEETGYRAAMITPFGWFYTSPGILTERMHAFVATGLTAGAQDLEDNEQIETVVLGQAEIVSLIMENKITDAKTIATLLKYFAADKTAAGAPAHPWPR